LFSSKQDLLELNKRQLETEIVNFENKKTQLIQTNNELKRKIALYNDSLNDRNLVLKKYEASFTRERQKIKQLNSELTTLKNTREDYKNQIAKLEKEFNAKKQKYLKEIESNYYQEIDYKKKSNNQANEIIKLNDEITDLKHELNLLKTNPFIIPNKKEDLRSWVIENMINYQSKKIESNKAKRKQRENNLDELRKKSDTLDIKLKVNSIK